MFRPPTLPSLKFILGVGLCSIGGAMLYVYFKYRDEEDEEIQNVLRKAKANGVEQPKEITIQVTFANEFIPLVVGRSGANLKIIEEKTGTRMRFREKNNNEQFCDIRGPPNGVKEAKKMLLKDIQRSPIVKEDIYVPQSVCGKIMGRCGESLKEISRVSLAKVSIESGDRSTNTKRRIVITGNRNQVNVAKKLIEEKIKEDEEYRKACIEIDHKREPRRSPTNSVSSLHSSQTSLNFPPRERLNLNDSEQPMEVYVSAIASPAKFWLQLIGPHSRKLDELVDDMTDYYNEPENQEMHRIADPYLGQIVAALFKYDGKWYRAEIVGILPNEYNPRDVVLDLYFVDYGDSEYISPHEVFELRTDFLTLRFQAIECYLAHIKPTLSNDPDNWDKQATAKFEELTQVASWKKLVSRVVTYKDRPKGGNHIRREGSPVPGVELFDPTEGVEVNIGHMLISHGFALPDYPKSNEVLRLDGGDTAAIKNGSAAVQSIAEDNDRHSNNNNYQSQSSVRRDDCLEQPSNINNHIKVLETITNGKESLKTNGKIDTERFLQSEKSDGAALTKSTNGDSWKNLIS